MLFLILYIFLDFCPLYILFTYVENNVHFHGFFLKRKKIRENAVKLSSMYFIQLVFRIVSYTQKRSDW